MDLREMQQAATDARTGKPVVQARDPKTGRAMFGWWEIRSERDRLRAAVQSARYWLTHLDPSNGPEAYAHDLLSAMRELDDVVAMLEVEVDDTREG